MNFDQIIKERRTIRKFTDYFVTDEDINAMFEAVRFTPSWANTQSWRFYLIRNKEIIEQLTEIYSTNNPAINCSRASSLLIVACYEKDLAGVSKRTNTNYNSRGNWGMFDLGAACQTLSLKIHEMGLGSVIIGAYNYESAKNILDIPNNLELAAIMAVGKPNEEKTAPKRKELNEIIIKTI